MEMSDVAGISRQREGQISNRETVGGVERATLQSSHITEYLFMIHEDVKKRAIECFLETAKIAYKGRTIKFQYLLPDYSRQLVEIDGDEFAEADYGLLIDNSQGSQELSQKLDMLAQAALQNQTLSFSTVMKLYNSTSLAEKQRLVEIDERKIQERNAQLQEQQSQIQQQELQARQEAELRKLELEDLLNQRDNETKVLIAQMNLAAKNSENEDGIEEPMSEEAREKLKESIRQFNEKLKLDRDKLNLEKTKVNISKQQKKG
jgi:hypothetical protein